MATQSVSAGAGAQILQFPSAGERQVRAGVDPLEALEAEDRRERGRRFAVLIEAKVAKAANPENPFPEICRQMSRRWPGLTPDELVKAMLVELKVRLDDAGLQ